MSFIRSTIVVRSRGVCELCSSQPMTEVHHLIGGSMRRISEEVRSCIGLCHGCHEQATNNHFSAMAAIETWAKKNASIEASACVTRRLTKISRMRGTP